MAFAIEIGCRGYLCLLGKRFPMEVLEIAQDTILVSAPDAGSLPREAGVDLEFPAKDGAMAYHARILALPDFAGGPILLQRSASVMRDERRRSWRVPVDVPMRLAVGKDAAPYPCTVINVSAEGALVETGAPLEIGDTFLLHLTLPGLSAQRLRARIVRVEPPGDNPATARRFGVWFTEVTKGARRTLTIYIWKQLRELRWDDTQALFPGREGRRRARKTIPRRAPRPTRP